MREETGVLRKMMLRISSRPESDPDRKAEEISRIHRMDVQKEQAQLEERD